MVVVVAVKLLYFYLHTNCAGSKKDDNDDCMQKFDLIF